MTAAFIAALPRRSANRIRRVIDGARAAARCTIFVLQMMPLPQRTRSWITREPIRDPMWFTTPSGRGEGDLYRPRSRGPHPAVLCGLGIVPAGVEHPLVRQLGEGLARAGYAALLFRSTTMRDIRLDPVDIPELVSAYEELTKQPFVDPRRSGLLGVCVGASFALMAAAQPSIRDRVAFVFAYAPYSSMWTLAVDIASGTRTLGDEREPWDVDPLTWQAYVRSITDWLSPDEARRLRDAFEARIHWNADKTVILRSSVGHVDETALSDDARAALRLLKADAGDVAAALEALPVRAKERIDAMSPIAYLDGIRAPRVMLLHDRYDHVIPVGESRRLAAALSARRAGVSYVELGLKHLRMPQGLSVRSLVREISRSYLAWYPLFRQMAA